MRFFLRTCLIALVVLPSFLLIAIALCFQDAPLVARTAQLSPQDIEDAKVILDRHKPSHDGMNKIQTIAIDERELELVLNYLANRLNLGAAHVQLRSGAASLQATIEVTRSPIGRYLNLDAILLQTNGLPRVYHLKIGNLPVPGILASYVLQESIRRMSETQPGEVASDLVKSIAIEDGRLTATYQVNNQTVARVRSLLVGADDQARMRAYHDRLVHEVERAPSKISLAELIPPLFGLALKRGASGDTVLENRAAIIVLAFYANGKGLGDIVPSAAQWPQPAHRTVTLAGRDDFPKHFLISAAISAAAGGPLADAIGVYKEIDDSRGGTGFSFNDIGADRAGTRFGQVAAQSEQRARKLARALSSPLKESDFMPDVSDLPEFMAEPEFNRRYGGVGAPRYNKMMETIEGRVAALSVIRQ
jgi:hypothetical protein